MKDRDCTYNLYVQSYIIKCLKFKYAITNDTVTVLRYVTMRNFALTMTQQSHY